jgi:hypothetical protein
MSEGKNERHNISAESRKPLEARLASIGWGLVFLWIGIAMLGSLHSGIGLFGIGIIILGLQLVRKYIDVGMEAFWVVIGLLFTFGGLGSLYEKDIPVLATVLVLAGLLLLVSAVKQNK